MALWTNSCCAQGVYETLGISTWMNMNKMFDTSSADTAGIQVEWLSVVKHDDQSTFFIKEEFISVLMCYSIYILITNYNALPLFWWPDSDGLLCPPMIVFTFMFSFSPTLTLKSHHLKQVYTSDCFIKGMFDDQSKATSACRSATVCW